jgi:CheY-like chemotaxis protein
MNATASVLIVDDEPSIRLMFRTALQSAGYDVVEAGDGPSAVAQLHKAIGTSRSTRS